MEMFISVSRAAFKANSYLVYFVVISLELFFVVALLIEQKMTLGYIFLFDDLVKLVWLSIFN